MKKSFIAIILASSVLAITGCLKQESPYLFPYEETNKLIKSGKMPKFALWPISDNFNGEDYHRYTRDEAVKFNTSTANLEQCAIATIEYERLYKKVEQEDKKYEEDFQKELDNIRKIIRENPGQDGLKKAARYAKQVDKEFDKRKFAILDDVRDGNIFYDYLKDPLLKCEKRVIIACKLEDERIVKNPKLRKVCVDNNDKYRYLSRYIEFKQNMYFNFPSTWGHISTYEFMFGEREFNIPPSKR